MAENKQNNQAKPQDVNKLLQVRREKLADLQAAGKDPFEITKYDVTYHSTDVKEAYTAHEAELLAGRQEPDVEGLDDAQKKEVLNNDYNEKREIMDASPIHVSIAGRMMFKRVMGKASFCNIQDLKGNIQVYVARDQIGEEAYWGYLWCKGMGIPYKDRRAFYPCRRNDTFKQVITDPSGEVPWLNRYRCQISSEICRPYHESGEQGSIYQAFTDIKGDPELPCRP